jgi:hypothetical protein
VSNNNLPSTKKLSRTVVAITQVDRISFSLDVWQGRTRAYINGEYLYEPPGRVTVEGTEFDFAYVEHHKGGFPMFWHYDKR